MLRLPAVLIAAIAEAQLTDAETAALGRTSTAARQALRAYRIRAWISLRCTLQHTLDAASFAVLPPQLGGGSLTAAQLKLVCAACSDEGAEGGAHPETADPQASADESGRAASAAASSSSAAAAAAASRPFVPVALRFGVIRRVRIAPSDICRDAHHVARGSSGCLRLAHLVSLLPASVREIEFVDDAAFGPLDHLTLPPTVQSIRWTQAPGRRLAGNWNGSFLRMRFPPALTSLELSSSFDHSLPPLPAGLLKLDLARAASEVALPDSLQELSFNSDHVPPLPPNLQSIRLGPRFNMPLGDITWPASLTLIQFSDAFNKPIEAVRWPSALLSLELGKDFDQPVEALQLPDSLTALCIGAKASEGRFNQPIARLRLPKSLISLELASAFNHPVAEVVLPRGLTRLVLGRELNHPLNQLQLPPSLLQLSLPAQCNIPAAGLSVHSTHLTSLVLPSRFNQPLDDLVLPASLTSLQMGSQCEQPMRALHLPPNLRVLELATCFGLPLKDWNPPVSLTDLTLSKYWNLVPHTCLRLPAALESLRFGERFDEPVEGMAWPSTLTQLHLGAHFKKPLRDLPATLQSLTISEAWNLIPADIRLPASLTSLTLEYKLAMRLLRELRRLPLLRTLHLRRCGITATGLGRSRAREHANLGCVPASVRTLVLDHALLFQQLLPPQIPPHITHLRVVDFPRDAVLDILRRAHAGCMLTFE